MMLTLREALAEATWAAENGRRWCEPCGVYVGAEPEFAPHICLVYNGPPCVTCSKPTITATIGAPGYGTVRSCKAGHSEELTRCGIYTPEDVR